LALAGAAGGVTAALAVLTGLRCGALASVLRGALAGDLAGDLAGVLEAGAALTAGLVAALPEDAVLSVLAAFALGAEEMVVSFMVFCLSKKLTVHTVYTVVFIRQDIHPKKSGEFSPLIPVKPNPSFAKRFFLRAASAPIGARVRPSRCPFAGWRCAFPHRTGCASPTNPDRAGHGTR